MQFAHHNGLLLSALSGGADSTALLLWLLEKGCRVEAVHCNFHLRGEESDRDEQFCKDLCRRHGIPLHIAHFDTVTFAQMHHQSIETAARNLRYRYFLDLACDLGADGVCVAHNRNDQAETLLMNLVRGAGIHGLTGMKAERTVEWRGRKVSIIRPLLDVSRKEIVQFLNARKQSWVTDSTNLETDATRNKFRLEVIPLLEKINPSAMANIADTCRRLQTVESIYDSQIEQGRRRVLGSSLPDGAGNGSDKAMAEQGLQEIHIGIASLRKETAPEALLFEIASRYGFNGHQVEDVMAHLDGSPGKVWSSATHQLLLDREDIVIAQRNDDRGIRMRIPEEGVYVVGQRGKIRITRQNVDKDFAVARTADAVSLDADSVVFPLTLRTVEKGDRFVPFGMRGSKLVSDFLTDNKLSLLEKRRQLVLCDASDRILWVVGRRPDNRFRITPETKSACNIAFINSKSL